MTLPLLYRIRAVLSKQSQKRGQESAYFAANTLVTVANTPEINTSRIISTQGDWTLTTAPHGASLHGLSYKGADMVTSYSGADNKVGGQGDVLIPFPGRIANGQYTFMTESYQLDKNDKEGPNAIHGFLRQAEWDIAAQTESAVTYTATLSADAHPGYPFALEVSLTYALSANGLRVSFEIENTGTTPAPVAAGFHPYFTLGPALIDGDTLHVPFDSYLEFDDALIPTGKVLSVDGTAFDFRTPRPVGEVVLNICYLHPQRGPDGLLRVRLSNHERAATVWMDAAYDYAVLYSGDPLPDSHRRRSLAIEPMTCGADGFNHADWGLVTLVPGETLTGTWGVSAE